MNALSARNKLSRESVKNLNLIPRPDYDIIPGHGQVMDSPAEESP